MNIGLVVIVIFFVLITLMIYLIKNMTRIEEKLNSSEINKKITAFIIYLVIIGTALFLIKYTYASSKSIFNRILFYNEVKTADKAFKEFDEKIQKEDSFYNDIIKKDYGEAKKDPYILEGFEYVEGDIASGYVVQDSNKNQYVWVPCTNKEDSEIVKLEKSDFGLDTYVNKHECADLEYEEFLESALEYGGFYISRFEIGVENEEFVSKPNVEVLSNISRENAIKKINNMYDSVNCKLINGYAYDVTLTWIKKNNDLSIQKLETKDNKKVISGRLKYNNIYDFTDNIMEVSLEDCYDTAVYRGFDYNEEIELNSRYNIPENEMENFDNYLGVETMNKLAFRTIIYK